jgi:D-lactate dehydrogenase (cytochrome)
LGRGAGRSGEASPLTGPAASHRVTARPALRVEAPARIDDADGLARYLSDASRFPGGHAPRVYLPTHEGHVAWVLQEEERVLAVGAQSSLTGGGTPFGEAVLSMERLTAVGELGDDDELEVGAGVALLTLREHLTPLGAFYPPAPTYEGASVGGTVGTNAAGAATFKYGSTRDWVAGLTVVLAGGHVLELRRGQAVASPEGTFEVALPDGTARVVPVPGYAMPDVPKRSAGYHAAAGMDLVDLFVGSEGTLGVVVSVRLRVLRPEPPVLVALVPAPDEARGLELVTRLREASRATWATSDPSGLDARAIEYADARCVTLLREDGPERARALSAETGVLLFLQLDLPPGLDAEEALQAYAEGDEGDTPVRRLFDLLDGLDLLDDAEVALPGDRSGREGLLELREAVPVCVNHRVERAKREVDDRIHKVSGDMVVPFERFSEAQAIYRRELAGLDVAIWGHVSDGNVHPNVIPTSHDDVERGHAGILACGAAIAALGGCPLSEHGTGRNPVKQALLAQLYGEEGIAEMRATKRALDPAGQLAPGVVFPLEG